MPPFAYEMHEMARLAWAPARAVSDVTRTWLENPMNPLSYTAAGRNLHRLPDLDLRDPKQGA